MWVRSQDKTVLVKCKNFKLVSFSYNDHAIQTEGIVPNEKTNLGFYTTVVKALKTLDAMQRKIDGVYIMPQDDEV